MGYGDGFSTKYLYERVNYFAAQLNKKLFAAHNDLVLRK